MPTGKTIAALIVASCFIVLCHAVAQDIPHFMEKLTTKEGLSSNKITDITQDDNGFLWIGTTDGLNRFDGTEVVQYFHSEKTNSPSHDYIYCLEKLPGNYIAIGTHAGLDFYNSSTGKFTNFYYAQKSPIDEYSNIISRMQLDDKGNLWAASSACIFVFDPNRQLVRVIPSNFTEADVTRRRLKFVEKMLPISNGDMLLYLSTGLKLYSFEAKRVIDVEKSPAFERLKFLYDLVKDRPLHLKDEFTPSANVFKLFDKYFLCFKPNVDSVYLYDESGKLTGSNPFPYNKYPYILWSQQLSVIDSTRVLFLCHNFGLVSIRISWENGKPALDTKSPLLFDSYEYAAAIRDQQNNWWLATTEQGLQKISPGKQYFKSDTLIDKLTGKPIQYDINFIVRYGNTFWISTYGNGFFSLDKNTGKTEQYFIYTSPTDRWPNFVWNIRQVTRDTLWVGTQGGLFWYSLPDKKYGRIQKYPGRPSVIDTVAITTQYVDKSGVVWMGLGKSKGLCSFDGQTRSFTYYPPNKPNGYPFRYPTAFAEDKNGTLWMVNDASGSLVSFDRNTGQFKVVPLKTSSRRGLSSLSTIHCKNDSTIWVGTVADGLVRLNPHTGQIKIYGHGDGLSSSHIRSIFEDEVERLWLCTEGDLSYFDSKSETFTRYSGKDGLPVSHPTSSFYYDRAERQLYTAGNSTIFYFSPERITGNQPPQKTIITAMHINGVLYMPDENRVERLRSWENDITIRYAAIDLTDGPSAKYEYKLLGEDTGWVMAGNQRQINFSRLEPGNYTFLVRASNNMGVPGMQAASVRFFIRPPFIKTVWFYGLVAIATAGLFYMLYYFRMKQILKTELIRSEISRNLHDEVGSTLTNISLGSLLAQKQLNDQNALQRILKKIYEDSQHVSESMREIVWSINPKIDTLGESLPRMLHYASELLEAQDITLQAEIDPGIEHIKLSMQQRRDLYMIFKETVNNLAKHSKATSVSIRFHMQEKALVMTVSDNGVGFDTAAPLKNNGLRNMQERAQRHQWKLQVRSGFGSGTSINLKAQIA